MVIVAPFVRLEAKPGKEPEVEVEKTAELLARPPAIEKLDVLAVKLPG